MATLGLVLLPAYWYFWKNAQNPEYDNARKGVTLVLAVMCWFLFIVGHVLNNTGDSDHEHDIDKHGVTVRFVVIARGVRQVQDLHHDLLDLRARGLLRDPVFQLSALQPFIGDEPDRLGL